MKSLKKILLSLVIAATAGVFSTSAMAENDPGRVTYKPEEAIDMVVGKIQIAIDGIDKGATGEEAAALIKAASDLSKEINARAKANRKLKSAATHAKESALQEAGSELKSAKEDFAKLKSLI